MNAIISASRPVNVLFIINVWHPRTLSATVDPMKLGAVTSRAPQSQPQPPKPPSVPTVPAVRELSKRERRAQSPGGIAVPPRVSSFDQARQAQQAKQAKELAAHQAPTPKTSKDPRPVVQIVVDRKNWAFANIANQLVKHLSHKYRLLVEPYSSLNNHAADVGVVMWWGDYKHVVPNARPRRIVLGVFDEISWKSGTRAPAWRSVRKLASAYVVANERIRDALTRDGRVAYLTEDGVDTDLFTKAPLPAVFTAAWAGNSMCSGPGYDLKGVKLIREACKRADVPLVTADSVDGTRPHADMPAFYRTASVYVCASEIEGTPNPVLEAMACGRPVISTDVGIVNKVVTDGKNGLIVERSVESLTSALVALRDKPKAELEAMGTAARSAVESFAWTTKVKAWDQALEAVLKTPETRKGR